MPRKPQRSGGPTLFDFAAPAAREEQRQRIEEAVERTPQVPTGGGPTPQAPAGGGPAASSPLEAELLAYIASRGRVTKEELYSWGRQRGLSTAAVIRAVESLASARRIRRRLNDEGQLAYEAA